MDVYYIVDNYLLASKLNDCDLSTSQTATQSPPLTWTFTATGNGCPTAGLTIIVNRGYYFPATGATTPDVNCHPQNPGGQLAVIGTCVSIQYAYPWKFAQAASLLGANAILPAQISAVAVSFNEI
jgi:hypothetical protein